MTNKNFIRLNKHFVSEEVRVNPSIDNVRECFNAAMLSMVQRWYDRLTNDARNAVKILNFNPTVVTGMMFFTNGSMDEECQYFGCDYEDIGAEMKNFALSIASNDEMYEKSQSREHYCNWYGCMAHSIRWYKKGIENIERLHEMTLSILPPDLKEEVLKNIISTDPACQSSVRNYYEALENGRKEMLRVALLKMRG